MVSSPTAPIRRRWELPFPRRRYPPGIIWEEDEEIMLERSEPNQQAYEDVDDDMPYYDDPEFTGFGTYSHDLAERHSKNHQQFPGF